MRSMLLVLPLLFAVACREAPQGYEENLPSIEDAPIDRHAVVFGESRFTYTQGNSAYCDSVYSIQGWVEEAVSATDLGCSSCAESYTLAHTLEDTSCDELRARGPATLAFMDFAFFPFDSQNPTTWDWLLDAEPDGAAGPAFQFALGNWTAAAPRDAYDVVLGVFEPADPDPRDWARQLLLQSRYVYPAAADSVYVGWQADLKFTE